MTDSKFTFRVVNETIDRTHASGNVETFSNLLRTVVHSAPYKIPKELLNAFKATFDDRQSNHGIFINWQHKF